MCFERDALFAVAVQVFKRIALENKCVATENGNLSESIQFAKRNSAVDRPSLFARDAADQNLCGIGREDFAVKASSALGVVEMRNRRVKYLQPNANNTGLAATLGLGGVPNLGPGLGGLPLGYFDGTIGMNQWGSVGTQNEARNVYQILDNVAKTLGNHSLKAGASFESIQVFDRYAAAPLGQYFFNGQFTGAIGSPTPTGSGVADFLVDQMHQADIYTSPNIKDAQWHNSAYMQDD